MVISKWFMLGEIFQVFCSSCLPFHLYVNPYGRQINPPSKSEVLRIMGGSMYSFRRPTHFVGVDLCEVRHHEFLDIKSFWNKRTHSWTTIEVMVRHYYTLAFVHEIWKMPCNFPKVFNASWTLRPARLSSCSVAGWRLVKTLEKQVHEHHSRKVSSQMSGTLYQILANNAWN